MEKETVPGGYLMIDREFHRPLYHGFAVRSDGSEQFLGVFEHRRDAEHEVAINGGK